MKTKRNLIPIWLLGAAFSTLNLQPSTAFAQPVTQFAGGVGHSLFLKSDGSLWVVGCNDNGQLGDGTYNTTSQPEQIVASGVTAIAGGWLDSLFIKSDGSLWGMGDNGVGQLGNGTYNNMTNQPEQIVASGVTAIVAAWGGDSLFIKTDGSLWGMGGNSYGDLGDGTDYATNYPKPIVASNVTAIAAGCYYSLFLKSDGSLWAMGWNSYGQLGDGTCNYYNYYNCTNRPEQIVASNVTAIAAGGFHSLFLKSDGSLWAMGENNSGQLGDGTYNDAYRPEQIMAGLPGYNQISGQLLSGGSERLSFVGIAGAKYALDRTFSLMPADWLPQGTNTAGAGGILVFTNTPNKATNNFWRIRSVP